MHYEPQKTLTRPAQERAELWRTGVGLLAIAVLSLIVATIWIITQTALADRLGVEFFHPGASPFGLVWTLSTFLCPTIALMIVLRVLHRRGILSLIGPLDLAREQFVKVFLVQAGVIALALILPTPGGASVTANLSLGVWLSWLPLALAMLAIQIGVEELIFRGYLQSQLAARLRHPAFWIGLPAVLFAVLHLDPSAGGNRWLVVGVTFAFALAAGDITARAGTLGPALAMHFVNNFASLMLVGAAEQMQGMALYIIPVDMSDPSLWSSFLLEGLLILISWLGARIVLRR